MIVVCPYTYLDPRTDQALSAYAPEAKRIYVGASRYDYWRLLVRLFSDEEPFMLIEHDIEIHETVIGETSQCPEPWCAWPYWSLGQLLPEAFGATRFQGEALAIGRRVLAGPAPHPWNRLDLPVADHMKASGLRVHHHEPHVLHHERQPDATWGGLLGAP